MNEYEKLANSIVIQASRDYMAACRKLARGRKNQEAEDTRAECLRFFRSGWFTALTDVDAEFLIRKLDEEVRHDR